MTHGARPSRPLAVPPAPASPVSRRDKVVGTMVVCEACKFMVWAHDSNYGDLRAVLNVLRIPCTICGARGNFDGFTVLESHLRDKDAWAHMHEIADREGYEWANSPDCTWRNVLHVSERDRAVNS